MTTPLRRFDHVGIAVHDTERALEYFVGRLGLTMIRTEEIPVPHVRLTYLDAGGGVAIQLVEPIDPESAVAAHLAEQGEGLHHIAFVVDDVPAAAAGLADPDSPEVTVGSGRGRPSAFVPGPVHHGVPVEVTAAGGSGGEPK